MKLLDKIHSKIDKTIKYVFQLESGLISEVAYIDNNTGKDIICVSTHTSCDLGCKFCHTTDCQGKVHVNYLDMGEMNEQIEFIHQDLKLGGRMLLISFMGCGEPLENDSVVSVMLSAKKKYAPCRFAVATLIPKRNWFKFFNLVEGIILYHLDVKIHLSLHFTDNKLRKEWMPAALEIESSIAALEFYQKMMSKLTRGSKVEVHYTLIEGVNDSPQDARRLCELLFGRDIPIKLLQYNERPTIDNKASPHVQAFMEIIERFGQRVEYYEPPGKGVGASCGEFLLDYYLKYNKKE
ncbi:MAG: hypothetical protein M0R80_02335 [Proteobacteria bacterium]|jgi:23S rRNA (adenine2503-C2)-methyltransferase|nr:hypothetical protein [Pseudomonadota bacterium]